VTNGFHRQTTRIRRSLGGPWMLATLSMALFSGVLYAAHPVVHPGLDLSHGTHSQSSVPDHCTLCQPNHDGAPTESMAALLETFDYPAPTPLLYVSPFRVEDPTVGSISPRAPPFPPAS
jgi:hypothetical protein